MFRDIGMRSLLLNNTSNSIYSLLLHQYVDFNLYNIEKNENIITLTNKSFLELSPRKSSNYQVIRIKITIIGKKLNGY